MSDWTVVIVSYNTRELLARALASVKAHAPGAAVWVVDNASDDGSADMVKADFPQAGLIENQANLGFARANNLAFEKIGSTYVLLLNPDAMLTAGALEALGEVIAVLWRSRSSPPGNSAMPGS